MYATSRTHTSVLGRQQVRDRLVAAERRFAHEDDPVDAPAPSRLRPQAWHRSWPGVAAASRLFAR